MVRLRPGRPYHVPVVSPPTPLQPYTLFDAHGCSSVLLIHSHTHSEAGVEMSHETYRFLPEYELGSTLESTPERRRREGADEQSTPEYERYGTDLSRAVRFTC